jgi:hypothetical protein
MTRYSNMPIHDRFEGSLIRVGVVWESMCLTSQEGLNRILSIIIKEDCRSISGVAIQF